MARTVPLPISLTRSGEALGECACCTIVWLNGEHDLATKLALAAVIERASELDHADVIVDLSEVTFMDAAVIGTLVAARNRLAIRGLAIHVRAPSRAALLVLRLCRDAGVDLQTGRHGVHRSGAAPALETWVTVPKAPRDAPLPAAAVADPAMALESDSRHA